MEAVVEEKEVRSKTQDVDIPDVHLGQYFQSICERFKERTALIDGITDERWSYAQLLELSSRVAAGLQKLGFKPGQLAGLHCEATPDIVFAFYRTVLSGGSMVFAKSSLTERELTYQFGDSRPILVFCDEANADKTKSACATISSVETLVIFGERENMVSFAMLKNTPLCELQPVPGGDSEQLLALIYSSGTTGFPKGVMLSSKNIVASICLLCNQTRVGVETFSTYSPPKVTHFFSDAPHAGGHCYRTSRFECSAITWSPSLKCFPLIWTHWNRLRHLTKGINWGVVSEQRSQIEMNILGIASLQMKKNGSLHVHGTDGGCHSLFDSLAAFRTTIACDVYTVRKLEGRTHAHVDASTNDSKGLIVPLPGYMKRPSLHERTFEQPHNCLRCKVSLDFSERCDVGYYMENGMFYVVDRMKEMIKCMDQQVAPAELEDLLLKHEDVREVAVAGVPHPEYGEAARAFVVLSNGHSGSEALKTRLFKLVADRSAPHKHLHGGLEFVSSIPKSETGKNLRRALRDGFLKKNVQGRI
ncbi:unnamed protein product [Ixodes persulcatus]